MHLDQNIAYYRKLCGYTQEQLAERLGVTGQSVSKWENGMSNPDISILPALAEALGVDINALFADDPGELKSSGSLSFPSIAMICFSAFFTEHSMISMAQSGLSVKKYCKRRWTSLKRSSIFPCRGAPI